MKPKGFLQETWLWVRIMGDLACDLALVLWYGFWIVGITAVVFLVFVEFILGYDFLAWVVGNPIEDILEVIRGKIERIKDSYNSR